MFSHRPWLLLAVLAAGCHRSDHESTDRPVPADRVLDFATLYGKNCAGCHGADGKLGSGASAERPDLPGDRAGRGRARI